jgi:hypothetical protein
LRLCRLAIRVTDRGLILLDDFEQGLPLADLFAGRRRLIDDDPVPVPQLLAPFTRCVDALREEDAVLLDLILRLLKVHADDVWHHAFVVAPRAGCIRRLSSGLGVCFQARR